MSGMGTFEFDGVKQAGAVEGLHGGKWLLYCTQMRMILGVREGDARCPCPTGGSRGAFGPISALILCLRACSHFGRKKDWRDINEAATGRHYT